jgi:hypothetical protein
MMDIDWRPLLQGLFTIILIALIAATFLGVYVWRRVRRLRLPPDTTFLEAMRLTPFPVVLLMDLLDLGLDFFSAPISWVILSRLGLQQLRGASVVQALIPGTQAIPTMTVAWVLVRLFGPRLSEIPHLEEAVNQEARRGQLQAIQKRPRRRK